MRKREETKKDDMGHNGNVGEVMGGKRRKGEEKRSEEKEGKKSVGEGRKGEETGARIEGKGNRREEKRKKRTEEETEEWRGAEGSGLEGRLGEKKERDG